MISLSDVNSRDPVRALLALIGTKAEKALVEHKSKAGVFRGSLSYSPAQFLQELRVWQADLQKELRADGRSTEEKKE